MSGYTPLFSTLLDGTLCGKWPHNGLWALLLSQCDRRGNIDMVPQLLAAKIGVPVEVLLKCIADFMEPDPGSRTGDLEGRRLELIDPASRDWGWRVVNHGIYREKARKRVHDEDRTESGKDAKRKREKRLSRDVPTCPDASRSQTADADADAKADSKQQTQTADPAGEARAQRELSDSEAEMARASRSPAPAAALNGNHGEPSRNGRMWIDQEIEAAQKANPLASAQEIATQIGVQVKRVRSYRRRTSKPTHPQIARGKKPRHLQ